jgi:hypothetical protein
LVLFLLLRLLFFLATQSSFLIGQRNYDQHKNLTAQIQEKYSYKNLQLISFLDKLKLNDNFFIIFNLKIYNQINAKYLIYTIFFVKLDQIAKFINFYLANLTFKEQLFFMHNLNFKLRINHIIDFIIRIFLVFFFFFFFLLI